MVRECSAEPASQIRHVCAPDRAAEAGLAAWQRDLQAEIAAGEKEGVEREKLPRGSGRRGSAALPSMTP